MSNNIENNIDPDLAQTFTQEFAEIYQKINAVTRELELPAENSVQRAEQINTLFRSIHTLKGNLQLVQFNDFAMEVHALENLLTPCRADNSKYTNNLGDQARLLLEKIQQFITGKLNYKPTLMHIIMAINRETNVLLTKSWVDNFNVAIKHLYQEHKRKNN